MPMYVELRDSKGRLDRAMPDPSGGTFDAAGDFDRFFDETYGGHPDGLDLPALASVDPYADTEMQADVLDQLLADIAAVLPLANAWPEHAVFCAFGLWPTAAQASRDPGSCG
jgi:hypothetical protein